MRVAVKIGTVSWRAWSGEPAEGEVIFDGEITDSLVWCDDLQSLREPTAAESLSAAKATIIPRIKAERDRRKFEGVTVGAHRFHSDPDSRTQQLGLVILGANIPSGLQWKTIGGSFVLMTQTLAGQIFGATAARDTAMFANAEAHIATVQAMTEAEAVLAYDYSTGWPE